MVDKMDLKRLVNELMAENKRLNDENETASANWIAVSNELEEAKKALAIAYGSLWRVLTPGPAEIMARKALLAVMTPEEQRAAIAAHGQPLQGRVGV